MNKKIAKKIWDEITVEIIKTHLRGLNDEKIIVNLYYYLLLTNSHSWGEIDGEIKKQFIFDLKKVSGLEIGEKQAGRVWNTFVRYKKDELKETIKKGINLSKEIARLGDKEVQTRINAAIKLGLSGDKRAIRPLLEALKDRNWDVKVAAVEALGELGDPIVLDDIRKLLATLERKINRIDNKIDNLETRIYKWTARGRGDSINEYLNDVNKLKAEIRVYRPYYERIEKVLESLKKRKFDRLAKLNENKLKEMDWQSFQDRVIEALNGIPSDKKVADMGIDGVTLNGIPIQVKQSENVGRNVVDNFETALRRYYPSNKKILKGIIVAFSFTKGAYEEAHRAMLEDNIKIDLVTVEELFE